MRGAGKCHKGLLGERLRLGAKVTGIDRKGRGYSLFFADSSSMDADIVVSPPRYVLSEMIRDMDKPLSNLVAEIPYPALSVGMYLVTVRKRVASPGRRLRFFDTINRKRKILGTLYDSSIFPNRAPEGHVLLRAWWAAHGLLNSRGKMIRSLSSLSGRTGGCYGYQVRSGFCESVQA